MNTPGEPLTVGATTAGRYAAPHQGTGDRIRVASAAALAGGGVLPIQVDGVDLVLVGREGAVSAFQGRCPHQGTLLAEGSLEDGILTCRGHGWRFDGMSGIRVGQPDVCLWRFTATVEGDDVWVDRAEILAWKARLDARSQPASDKSETRFSDMPARPLTALPCPHGLPWLGNALQLRKTHLHTDLERWGEKFGPIYRFSLMNRPVVVISDGEWIDRILRDRPGTFRRASVIEALSREIGTVGVFSAEGEAWLRHRRPVAQALDARHLRDFFPTLVNVTRRLQRRWDQAAAEGRSVHVQHDLMQYAVDVTTSLAFGHDMNTLEGHGGEVQHHLEHILPMIARRLNSAFPYWHYIRLPADRAFDRSVEAVRAALGDIIAATRERLSQSPELAAHPRNFLESMIAAQAAGEAALSDDELFANAFTLLLAGEDTTANTIAWILYIMCLHPEVQRRMQEETGAVLGTADVLTDMQDAARLVYLDAVAHESLRLKPVAPLIYLEPNEDVAIAGYLVPKGTLIVLVTRPNALRESQFAAAGEFRPERWLETSAAAHHRSGFVPFGSGPRLCPGRSLALLEAKAALSMVCQHFTVRLAPASGPVSETFAFTMMPTGLRVVLERRQAGARPV
ncbi:cytochrome P450 [Cupriavidus sp. RAF12]|uniref:cytochrome P450 n=1 Tax=Cupriavidus sp. RAF12 TaxID=3233050 RepID=UPI003F8F8E38